MVNSTKIPNNLIKDSALSLQAKGLYTVLAFLKNIPNFNLTQDSIEAFANTSINSVKVYIKELKEAGYLTIQKYKVGQFYKSNYILADVSANFTFVDNEVIKDRKLKCSHKGLYAIFSAFRTNFTEKAKIKIKYLKTLSKNGVRSFNTVFRELKKFGLIKQIKTSNGRFQYDYIFKKIKSIVASEQTPDEEILDTIRNNTYDDTALCYEFIFEHIKTAVVKNKKFKVNKHKISRKQLLETLNKLNKQDLNELSQAVEKLDQNKLNYHYIMTCIFNKVQNRPKEKPLEAWEIEYIEKMNK